MPVSDPHTTLFRDTQLYGQSHEAHGHTRSSELNIHILSYTSHALWYKGHIPTYMHHLGDPHGGWNHEAETGLEGILVVTGAGVEGPG